MKKKSILIFLGAVLCPMLHGQSVEQSVTVTADAGPDESISQSFMALDRDCRVLVNKRTDAVQAIPACKKVADEADKFAPQSHFITRRAAYVFYTLALIQGRQTVEAVMVGNKAVLSCFWGTMTGQVPALRTACERKRKRWLVIWRLRIKTLRGLRHLSGTLLVARRGCR